MRLVDWDGWRVDTAGDDRPYMLALHWYPDWRRRDERDSVQRYHRRAADARHLERIMLAVHDLGCLELLD